MCAARFKMAHSKLYMGGQNTHFWMCVCVCVLVHFTFILGGPANGVKRVELRDASGMQRGPWYSTRYNDFFIKNV